MKNITLGFSGGGGFQNILSGVEDPNKLNLDPDPKNCLNVDPDPELPVSY